MGGAQCVTGVICTERHLSYYLRNIKPNKSFLAQQSGLAIFCYRRMHLLPFGTKETGMEMQDVLVSCLSEWAGMASSDSEQHHGAER